MFRICYPFYILKALLFYIFLSRYAFLYYVDIDEAANIVKNADKFKINDQSLLISFFDLMKSTSRKREPMNYDHYSSEYFKNSP